MNKQLEDNQPSTSEGVGDSGAASKGDLKELEQTDASSALTEGTTFKYEGPGSSAGNGGSKLSGKSSSRIKRLLGNKKALLLVGSVGGIAIGLIIWLIIILMGTLLIPQIMQQITAYQFARVTSEFADNAQRIADEKLALEIEANSPTEFKAIEDKFATASTDATSLWDKMLNQFSTNKAIDNLKTNNGLSFNYENSKVLNRPVLKSITLDTLTYPVESQGFTKYIPIIGKLVKFGNDVNLSKNFASSLRNSLRSNETGMIARSAAAADFRQQAGIGLVAWTTARLSDFLGKNSTDARLLEEGDQLATINKPALPDPATDAEIVNADNAVNAAQTTAESSPAALQAAIDNGGTVAAVKNALTSSLANSGIADVVKAFNPIYAIAMPICIIYDGSLDKSGNTIDNATTQQARSFYYLAAAGNQEQYGSPGVNAEAVGAVNNAINSPNSSGQYTILNSGPEIRASGGTVNTSQSNISGEASSGGQFTLLNVAFGNGALVGLVETFANYTCPYLTNLYIGGGLALFNIALAWGTGGADEGLIKGASAVAQKAIDTEAASGFISNLFVSTLNGGSRVVKMLLGTAKSVGEITGATLAAKLIVMSKATQVNNGFAQGSDLVNQADAGGNFVANEADQKGFYGAPLDTAAVIQSNQATKVALAQQESQKSFSQRYFALTDANSLISRIAMTIYTNLNNRLFTTISSAIGRIFNPVALFSNIFGSFNHKITLAAGTADTSNYGNVQFGWTQSEENLISSSASYSPLENQNYLDTATPAEKFIQDTYGKCFSESIGTMLSSGDLVRDSQGSVVDNPFPNQPDKAICSPINLGPNNPLYGDLVFRWRLAMSYTSTVNEYAQASNPGS